MTPTDAPLAGRSSELAVSHSVLTAAGRGRGGVLVVEGPPGSGRTSFLTTAVISTGLTGTPRPLVLRASATSSDHTVPFDLARQLLEPWWIGATEAERAAALAGSARLAAPLFDYRRGGLREGELAPQTAHGLYWLCRNLATARPLVVAVDDLQWADPPSLELVRLLARRAHDLPLAVLVTTLPEPCPTSAEALTDVCTAPRARVLPLPPLTAGGVEAMVAHAFGQPPAACFVEACREASGGNPLLLTDLLTDLLRGGRPASEESIGDVRAALPPLAVRHVRRWLGQLPPTARTITETLAVLGGQAELRQVAAVAELPLAEAADAARRLARAGLLAGVQPPQLAHGMLRRIAYEDLGTLDRMDAHARAARVLARDGLPLGPVADHLAATSPSADAWAVRTLRAAADVALQAGRPVDAARWLRRALHEPPPPDLRAALLTELGAAERRARAGAASALLESALDAVADPTFRTRTAVELSLALTAEGRHTDAVRALATASAVRPGAGHPADDGSLGSAAQLEFLLLGETLPQVWPDPVTAAAHGACQQLRTGASAAQVAAAADQFLSLWRAVAPDAVVDGLAHPLAVSGWLLLCCERLDQAGWVAVELLDRAAATGRLLAASGARVLLAAVALRRGHVSEALHQAHAVVAETGSAEVPGPAPAWARAVLVECLVHAGRLAEADSALDRGRSGARPVGPVSEVALLRARGLLRGAQNRFEEAVSDLVEVDRRAADASLSLAGVAGHRLHLAAMLHRVGRLDDARAVVEAEMAWARSFGAVRPFGSALRAAGLLRRGAAGLAMLHDAVRLLADCPARLDHAAALVDLGAALRRAGHRAEARRRLRAGIELAERGGATSLSRRALSELSVAGGRMRSAPHRGGAALTPSERRVALLAASGLRNDEIARQLFVTVKAVEWHLSHVYPKLGIRRRAELPVALAAAGIADERAEPA
jgi:DNA-binding CsgD family transcriptional regulator